MLSVRAENPVQEFSCGSTHLPDTLRPGGGYQGAGEDGKLQGAIVNQPNSPGVYGGKGGRGKYFDLAIDTLPYVPDGTFFTGYGAGGTGAITALPFATNPGPTAGVGFGIYFSEYFSPWTTRGPNSAEGGSAVGKFDGTGLAGTSGFVVVGFIRGGGSAAGLPGPPTDVTATFANGTADVSWTAPDDGGSPITGYTVRYSTDGSTWTIASMCTGTATRCTVTGLVDGVPYMFEVRATNANGDGPWSAIDPRFAG